MRRLVAALAVVAVLLTPGCARRMPESAALSSATAISAAATGALADVWVPANPDDGRDIQRVEFTHDGEIVESVIPTGLGRGAPGFVRGTWRATGPGTVVCQRDGSRARATYRFAATDSTLTLTWVAGTAPDASEISAGPAHYVAAETDSWVTGSHGAFVLAAARARRSLP